MYHINWKTLSTSDQFDSSDQFFFNFKEN